MATLYWGPALVGGSSTGNWDGSTTTNWFTNVARTIQASAAPTSVDDVIFDNASAAGAFVVTIVAGAVCRDVTISGVPASMTLAGSAAWTVYGSLSFPAVNLTRTYSGTVTFAATTTGKTITTNGVTLTSGSATFDGVGGGWTLGSALTVTTTITLTNGTLDTSASNYAVTTGSFSSSNSNTRSLVLNGSTLTLSTSSTTVFNAATGTNFTLSATSASTVLMTATSSGITCSTAQTFGNVTASAATTICSIVGPLTFNNMTISTRGASGYNQLTFANDVTIGGTLTLNSGGSYSNRTFIYSSVLGTPRTLTVATLAAATDLDFRDITAAGASAPWSDALGTSRWGNCGGNSNITFRAGVPKYWVAGTASWSANAWSSASGGAASTNDFPLAQDTATFDDASAAGITVTMNATYNVGTITFAARTTRAVTFAMSANAGLYGNFLLSSQVTYSGTGVLTFFGATGVVQQIDSAGKTITGSVTLSGLATYRLINNNFTIGSTLTTTFTTGAIDLNNLVWSTGIFTSNNSNTRSIAFGTGKLLLTGNAATILQMQNATNYTCTGSRTIECNYAGATGMRVIQCGDNPLTGITETTAPNLVISGNGTDIFAFYSSAGLCRLGNFDGTGFLGTYGDSTNGNRNAPPAIYGNAVFNAGANFTGLVSASQWTFIASAIEQTVDFAGLSVSSGILMQAPGGLKLLSNTTIPSTKTFTLTAGKLNLNNLTLSTGTVTISGSTARSIDFGTTGKITVTGAGASAWQATGSNFSTLGTGTIEMASASAKTFTGGAVTYGCTLDQKGAGTLTIANNNTFGNITNSVSATAATTITLTAGTTQTLTAGCGLVGAAGFVLTLNTSTPGTRATISYSGLSANLNYVNVKDITAKGGCRYYAFTGSVNSGNNSGLVFSRAAMRGMGGLMVAI